MRMPTFLARRDLAAWSLVLSLLALGAWHGTRLATESRAPVVKVRWSQNLSAGERTALEDRFQLVRPEPIGPATFNYDLLDSRPEVIRALVEHPAVADTGDLDRNRSRLLTTTDRGSSTRWLWHWFARDWIARRVSHVLSAWLLLSLVGFVIRDSLQSE